MKINLSRRFKILPEAVITKLLKIAEENREIISLGPGEPDFISPDYILNAARKGIDDGNTHYSPAGGRSDLKEAIVYKLKKDNGIEVNENNIIVTCGSTEALYLALLSLINPGDKILVPDPGFLAYTPMILLLDGKPVSVPLKKEEEFEFNTDVLKNLIIREKPKILIINSPGNPTGTVLSRKILEEIADLAVEHNLLIFSDEAYEHFIYGNAKHYSIASFNGMENYVITFQSFSKTFAMPGFRVGYSVGNEEIIKAMTKLHIYTTLSAPTISQIAAKEALENWEQAMKSIMDMRKSYDKRRRLILKRLNEIEIFETHNPEGAFYVFPKFNLNMKSLNFAELMLERAKVAVMPGSEFGKYGEGFIRMSYATDYHLIEKAMDRIEDWVKKERLQ